MQMNMKRGPMRQAFQREHRVLSGVDKFPVSGGCVVDHGKEAISRLPTADQIACLFVRKAGVGGQAGRRCRPAPGRQYLGDWL